MSGMPAGFEVVSQQLYADTAGSAWQGRAVQLCIRVRRFRRRNRRCRRKVFAERLPDVVERFGRRTTRLTEIVRLIGHTAGGLPGSRILNRLAIAISDETVIRTVKHGGHGSSLEAEPVRYLGVGDWA